jgi:hypothetical protein
MTRPGLHVHVREITALADHALKTIRRGNER